MNERTQEAIIDAGITCERCGRDGTEAEIEQTDGGDWLCEVCDEELALQVSDGGGRWERQQMGVSAL